MSEKLRGWKQRKSSFMWMNPKQQRKMKGIMVGIWKQTLQLQAFEKTKEKASVQGINIVSLSLNSMLLLSNEESDSN